jgi:uncharacterized membrane protein
MESGPVNVVVASFRYEVDARAAVKDLDIASKQDYAHVREKALVTRDDKNKLRIDEAADKGFGHGAMIGGVAGATVGLLAGPIGWAALGGAAIGGLASKLRDTGFPDEQLRRLGQDIEQGSAALVTIVEPTWLTNVQRILEQHGAKVTTNEVSPELAAQLDREAAKEQESK